MDKVFGKRVIKKKVILRELKPSERDIRRGTHFLEIDFNGVTEIYELRNYDIHREVTTNYRLTPIDFELEVTCLSGDRLYSWLISGEITNNHLPMWVTITGFGGSHTYTLHNSRPVRYDIREFNGVLGTVDLGVTFRPDYYILEIN